MGREIFRKKMVGPKKFVSEEKVFKNFLSEKGNLSSKFFFGSNISGLKTSPRIAAMTAIQQQT